MPRRCTYSAAAASSRSKRMETERIGHPAHAGQRDVVGHARIFGQAMGLAVLRHAVPALADGVDRWASGCAGCGPAARCAQPPPGRRKDGARHLTGPRRSSRQNRDLATPRFQSTGLPPATTSPCTRSVVTSACGGRRVLVQRAAHHGDHDVVDGGLGKGLGPDPLPVAQHRKRGRQSAPARPAGARCDDAHAAALQVLDHGQQPVASASPRDEVSSSMIKSLCSWRAPWRSRRAAAGNRQRGDLGIRVNDHAQPRQAGLSPGQLLCAVDEDPIVCRRARARCSRPP